MSASRLCALSLLLLAATAGAATAAPETLLGRLKKQAESLPTASLGKSETRLTGLPPAELAKLRRGPRLTEADYNLTPEEATQRIRKMGIVAHVTVDRYVVFEHPAEFDSHGKTTRKREPWLAMARARELLGAEPMTREESIAKLKALGIEVENGVSRPDFVRPPLSAEPRMAPYTNMGAGWVDGPAGDYLATAQRRAWEQKQVMTRQNQNIEKQVRALGFQAELFYGAGVFWESGRSNVRNQMDFQHLRGVHVFIHAGEKREGIAIPVADALGFARAWVRLHRPPSTEEYRPPLQIAARDRKAINDARRLGFEVALVDSELGLRATIRPAGALGRWETTVDPEQIGQTVALWMKLHRAPTEDERKAAESATGGP
jgi:hypothetical protein